MKLFSILMGICFIFSVSQKSFACESCAKNKPTGKAPASATAVADAKDAAKTDAKATPADEKATCSKDGKGCACAKDGKECKCKECANKKAHNHKKGEKCDCGNKEAA